MNTDSKKIDRMFAILVLGFALLVGGVFITSSTQEDSNAASQRLRWFGIEEMMGKAGARCGNCKNCGSSDMSFVEAVGHKDYTSYIFICNSCLKHTEFDPKGIPLSRWDID